MMDILLVDDNAVYLRLIKDILYSNGYSVTTATNGAEACEILGDSDLDLIISDIKMPNVDGIGLHQFVRAMKQHAETKFVYISGHRDVYSDRLKLTPDRDYFLDKTMAAGEIVKFIDKLVFGKYAEVWV